MSERLSFSESEDEKLVRLINLLPKELQVRWGRELEDLETHDAIVRIEEILKARTVAKEKIFTDIQDIESKELQEEVRNVVSSIEKTYGDTNYFVGNGSVAEVYEMPYAPHVCVKYLTNPKMAQEHGNNFREEVEYMNDLHGFAVEGVRIPNVYFYHTSDFGTCFGMEKIEGHSLNIIMEDPTKISYLEEIKKQDMKTVIDNMKAFITTMHTKHKIVHRDLSGRNIMVDKNGEWFVIDFGRAKRIEIGDDSTDISQSTDVATIESSIRNFYAKIA